MATHDDTAKERWEAVRDFLNAGMPGPASTATMVAALGEARRAVTTPGLRLDDWLAGQVRLRGIREAAAVLAMLEVPGRRQRTAEVFRRDHPDRGAVLDRPLAVLEGRS